MPVAKSEFDELHPCEFYTPEELFDPEKLYTVPEIGRLLQELEPDAELDPETESVLIDWTIPWIINNAESLVVANPRSDTEPGYYGLRTGASIDQ
ncbi:MAG: DUF5827 family protein [Halobacteriales archaeon]